ncbi:hypothetical protein LAZ67_17000292 [Cordylochernes scorpioides]|uniref:Peptidase A2 domain-containing protein n=1 Tax=Cordylochernes scorpioides TaxID=51811 RepID=A0ABY6LCL5_9ARAC|nr:hypothetical protein LAZ67_17000292 [Cordylochernes scorpioides]
MYDIQRLHFYATTGGEAGPISLKKKRKVESLQQEETNMNIKKEATTQARAPNFYIQDILRLCKEVDPHMNEEEKISHLMKGIAEELYQALLPRDVHNTEQFVTECRRIEALHCKRVTKFRNPPLSTTLELKENYIDIEIEGKMTHALVDSGASYSVISERFKLKLRKIMFAETDLSRAVIDSADDTIFLEKCLFENTPKNSSPLYSELEYRIEPASIQLIGVASRDIPNEAIVVAECRKELLLERELTALSSHFIYQ